jgi:hypothetical protein
MEVRGAGASTRSGFRSFPGDPITSRHDTAIISISAGLRARRRRYGDGCARQPRNHAAWLSQRGRRERAPARFDRYNVKQPAAPPALFHPVAI